jgi:hypothetical protein
VGTGSPSGSWDSDDRFADLPPVDIEIPDDASELDEEVRRYRLEQTGRGGTRNRALRLLFTRRWNTYGLSGPLVVAILLVVALVGALASLLTPRDPPARAPSPLSTRASAPPGRAGALLPNGRIRIAGVSVDLRGLRPAVFALVPPSCPCDGELDRLFAGTKQYRLDLLLVPLSDVTGEAQARAFRSLVSRVGNGSAQSAEDVDGALRRAYEPRGLTAVLVRSDGVVSAVYRGLPDLRRLELDLARLAHPQPVP